MSRKRVPLNQNECTADFRIGVPFEQNLQYSQYLQFLIGKYMDLAQADEEREERENEIYLEYPEYYEDERILEEEEKWLEEFLNQLPEKKREYFEKLIKES